MRIQRQIATGRLVLGVVWLTLTGTCTGMFTLQADGEFNGALNTISLWIGSAFTAPAVWLISMAVRELFGRRASIWLVASVAAAAVIDGVVILIGSAPGHAALSDLLFAAPFVLVPGGAYGLWALLLSRAPEAQPERPPDIFD